MDSVQIENGFTRISNELLEAIMRAPLSKREIKVVLAVARKTYGFGKKEDDLGLAQLSRMTALNKADVSRAISDLVTSGVLIRRQGDFGHILGINKDFKMWGGVGDLPTVGKTPTVGEIPTPPLVKHQLSPLVIHQPSKENHQKKNSKESASALFNQWYSIYPNKKARGDAEKAFIKLNPNSALVEEMVRAVEQQQLSRQRRIAAGEWEPDWKYPATWLNKQCWKDELTAIETKKREAVV